MKQVPVRSGSGGSSTSTSISSSASAVVRAPTKKRASGPCSAFSASAAASESAARYLNGAGFMAHIGLIDQLAVAYHCERHRVLAQRLEHIGRFEYDEVRRRSHLQYVLLDV